MADDQLTVLAADGSTQRLRSRGQGGSPDKQAQLVEVYASVRVYDGTASQTLTATAAALPSIPANARFADVYCEGAASTDYARYWETGTPTAAVGKKLKDDAEINVASLASFRAIIGAGAPVLRIAYWHYAARDGE